MKRETSKSYIYIKRVNYLIKAKRNVEISRYSARGKQLISIEITLDFILHRTIALVYVSLLTRYFIYRRMDVVLTLDSH